jgi:hypothetical protein
MNYTPKQFTIPQLEGISKESVEAHLGLYAGYVKNFNAMSEMMPEYAQDPEKHTHALAEIIRRRSFEWDGMRLHELYFEQFEGGATAVTPTSAFAKQLETEYHKFEYFIGMVRAIGGVIARADDGEAGLRIPSGEVAPHIENRWEIGDFSQELRVFRIEEWQYPDAIFFELFGCPFEGEVSLRIGDG